MDIRGRLAEASRRGGGGAEGEEQDSLLDALPSSSSAAPSSSTASTSSTPRDGVIPDRDEDEDGDIEAATNMVFKQEVGKMKNLIGALEKDVQAQAKDRADALADPFVETQAFLQALEDRGSAIRLRISQAQAVLSEMGRRTQECEAYVRQVSSRPISAGVPVQIKMRRAQAANLSKKLEAVVQRYYRVEVKAKEGKESQFDQAYSIQFREKYTAGEEGEEEFQAALQEARESQHPVFQMPSRQEMEQAQLALDDVQRCVFHRLCVS
jgi:t-SNARE complex subunit (syntaxin)